WGTLRPAAPAARMRCLTVEMPPGIKVYWAGLSRDESTIYVGGEPKATAGSDPSNIRMYARPIGSYEYHEVPGTEGEVGGGGDVDSRLLLFLSPVSPGATELRLARVPLDGSAPPTTLADWKKSWSDFDQLSNGDLVIRDGALGLTRIPKGSGSSSLSIKV